MKLILILIVLSILYLIFPVALSAPVRSDLRIDLPRPCYPDSEFYYRMVTPNSPEKRPESALYRCDMDCEWRLVRSTREAS